MKILTRTSLTVVCLALGTLGVQAQAVSGDTSSAGTHGADIVKLSAWNYDALYGSQGMRAEQLLGSTVVGSNGDEIGAVEDAIVHNGEIVAIIAEVGSFWDVGGVHIAVPWKQVELVDDGIAIPVSEGDFEQYALHHETSYVNQGYLRSIQKFGRNLASGAAVGARCATAGAGGTASASDDAAGQDMGAGTCAWRLTALVGDYVTLANGTGYGYLEDVVFKQNGAIQAIIVDASGPPYGYASYAYPFNGYAVGRTWNPYNSVYTLPYSSDDIEGLQAFDSEQYQGLWS